MIFALVFSGIHSPVSKRSGRFLSYDHPVLSVRKFALHGPGPELVLDQLRHCCPANAQPMGHSIVRNSESLGCIRYSCVYHRGHHRPHRSLREAIASWYGPADSGGNLACGGGALTSSTLGVANKTLPCNTKVRVCENPKGPCVNVSVVDRGPYVAGREFDLTEATARTIGFLSVGVGPIWVSTG